MITSSPFTNSATRTATDQVDRNPLNDSAAATINPIEPTADIAVTKSVDPPGIDGATPAIPIGERATFTVTTKNNGPFDATGVAVRDVIPPDLIYDPVASTGDGTYDPATGLWTIGALANGAIASRTFVVTGTQVGTYTNLAATTGTSTPRDPNPTNNSASADLAVRNADTDLVIVKTPFPQVVTVGDTVTYQLAVTNLGPELATAVVVGDVWPPGVSVTIGDREPGHDRRGRDLWDIGAARGRPDRHRHGHGDGDRRRRAGEHRDRLVDGGRRSRPHQQLGLGHHHVGAAGARHRRRQVGRRAERRPTRCRAGRRAGRVHHHRREPPDPHGGDRDERRAAGPAAGRARPS